MDSSIAIERLDSVTRVDSITFAEGDFLASHVPIKNLGLPHRFEYEPNDCVSLSEEEVYQKYVLNPDNKHQLIAVYGESGTGKSHLIRWFETRYRLEKPSNEVVVFIKRSDNSLKGTIRQLLEHPDIKNIINKDVCERLENAIVVEEEAKLKDRIYYDFIIEIEHDEDEYDIHLSSTKKAQLAAFLQYDGVKKKLLESDGPIERIYSKVAEHSFADRDTVAEFLPEDFLISSELCETIDIEGDRKAGKLAKALASDEVGLERATQTSDYLNQFVDVVIQRCAGIEPGDFRDIFQDLRKSLHAVGKNLTLFIEDITSFTGVDSTLLDALIVENTGMNEEDAPCRISSFVGTTSNYLLNHFRDNHKDRVSQYIFIPSDAFDKESLFEFFGRYLNTMSLSQATLDNWVRNRASSDEYPVHVAKEGANWDHVELEDGKRLCLYPFSKQSIINLCNHVLKNGKKTPRYIITDIIREGVAEILYDKSRFPSFCDFRSLAINSVLSYRITNQIKEKSEADRLLYFLAIWGDGNPCQTQIDGITYFSSIREDIFQELSFPAFTLPTGDNPTTGKQERPTSSISKSKPADLVRQSRSTTIITDAAKTRVQLALDKLNEWVDGAEIDLTSSGGASGIIQGALKDIDAFVFSAINWQAEGLSQDNVVKISDSAVPFVSLGGVRGRKTVGLYVLPVDRKTVFLLSAFIRWREFGGSSWNYEDAIFDAYYASYWLSSVKKGIVQAANDTLDKGVSYIQAAIAAEMIRQILTGEYPSKNLNNFTPKYLLSNLGRLSSSSGHCDAWKTLISTISQKGEEETNKRTIRGYFNIVQGAGGTIVVLNDLQLKKDLETARKRRFVIPEAAQEPKDRVKPRNDAFAFFQMIMRRVEHVVDEEKKEAREILEVIAYNYCLDGEPDLDIEEDDILELTSLAEQFYSEVNETRLSIPYRSSDAMKASAKKVSISLEAAREAVEEEDVMSSLMAFSTDPLKEIRSFRDYLEGLKKDIDRANLLLERKKENLGDADSPDSEFKRYVHQKEALDDCLALLSKGDAN